VLGAGGQVGAAVVAAAPRGWTVHGLTRADTDIANMAAVQAAVSTGRWTAVVNAAAYTAVDQAEAEPDRAFVVNRDGAGNVARACSDAGAVLIHLSTDYVFDGKKTGPYVEEDTVGPLSVYGRSKAAGEQAVQAFCPNHLIIRTSRVFAPHGAGFVAAMLRLGREREELRLIADQVGCPTAAGDVAGAIWRIAGQLGEDGVAGERGIFHFTGTPPVSWLDFGRAVFAAAAMHGMRTPRLEPTSSASYPQPAARPAMSVLDCTRIRRAYGVRSPDWEPPLRACVEAMLRGEGAGEAR
jgi:dTDP-4-dehydrorhamnose reductase